MKYSAFAIIAFLMFLPSCQKKATLEHELELQRQHLLLWEFPLPRTHTGALLGNGVQGLMVWGVDNQLNITIGRAGFWDRRGGNKALSKITYNQLKQMLLAGNEDGIKSAFGIPEVAEPGQPTRPHQIGGGRLEIEMPEGWELKKGVLDLHKGIFEVTVRNEQDELKLISIRQSVFEELAVVSLPEELEGQVQLRLVPSWEHVKNELEKVSVQPPVIWQEELPGGAKINGFTQTLPQDAPLSIGYKSLENGEIIIGSKVSDEAKVEVVNALKDIKRWEVKNADIEWWQTYWNDVPKIHLPDPILQDIVNYGLYKQAICTPEHGIACSLQGPFNEEYQLPPWSNDYHYNINIQMIYLPALATNRANHLNPIWKMIHDMMPELKKNGEHFFERPGALMLPHAVDDKGKVVGSFWTGTIDHACTAWMAQIAWQHYLFTKDEKILKETAWPLLVGAFEGYWAMLEEKTGPDGQKTYSLPVSVSPEFRGSQMNAWGRDASFQLAAFHRTAKIISEAANALGLDNDPRWADVSDRLPKFTTITGPASLESPSRQVERIALWEGMDLIESHRHHSFMAGIYPFDVIDPLSPETSGTVRATYDNWIRKGAGVWSGWCVPWAAILHNRNNEPEAAVSWLHYWYWNFLNEGRGTLHNAAFGGISNISSPGWHNIPEIDRNREIMQLDAGFGALSAVLDLLVYYKQGTVYLLPKIPRDWRNLDFSGIAVEGGFLIGAKVDRHKTMEITIKSKFGGTLKLAHGLGDKFLLNDAEVDGAILEREFQPGEGIVLKRIR